MSKNNLSTSKIYELINQLRTELNAAILRVEGKVEKVGEDFNKFEAGRLSVLEKDFAELRAKHIPIERLVYGMVALILTSVLGALLYLVVK